MPNHSPIRQPDPSDSLFGPSLRRGPVTLLLDLLSSVRFGIVQMIALFAYCTVGSAGIIYPELGPGHWNPFDPGVWRHDMIRQWRVFELTEFEWFHTPFFNAMIALLCVTLVVTTLRRIRFNALTLGVWMIHSGIVILCIGSYVYFGTKFEGDAPVLRCTVKIEVPGAPAAMLPAMPGNGTSVRTESGEYQFSIVSIDPSWELRTEAELGKSAYAVTIDVQTPTSRFMRQLLAGYPQFTEDVIQGKGRVKKLPEFNGEALVDKTLQLSLQPAEQDSFWVKDSAAIDARRAGESSWSQRVIHGLPRYNDYVGSLADVWPSVAGEDERPLKPRVLDLPVGASGTAAADPLAGLDVRISGFLRYAVMRRNFVAGGPTLNPVADISMTTPDGRSFNETLVAFDESRRSAYDGRLSFEWIESAADLPQFLNVGAQLVLRVPAAGIDQTVRFTNSELLGEDRPLIPLGESGWQYRIREAKDRLPLSSGRSVTLLLVDLVNPEGKKLTRWVFEDPSRNRDNLETAPEEPHAPQVPDARLETEYRPGRTLSTISLVSGPGDVGLHVFHDDGAGGRVERAFKAGESVEIIYGIKLVVNRLIADATEAEKPVIVPWRQRDKDSDAVQAYALVRVDLSKGEWRESRWVPFHRYTFEEPFEPVGMLSRYEPARITLPDGNDIELVVGRERRALPNPVRLDDFVLTSNIGGFTGRTSSVRDWTSVVQFKDGDSWSDAVRISTNDPGTFRGMWFFQAFWDPPRQAQFAGDVSSQGLNFTGLGVGNRHGVYAQLLGCCIAVAGMIYAFYVKPIIRRRRRLHVLAEMEAGRLPRRERVPLLDETPIRDDSISAIGSEESAR